MFKDIGYFWSFVVVWLVCVALDSIMSFGFGMKPLSSEVKIMMSFVIVWATAKDQETKDKRDCSS